MARSWKQYNKEWKYWLLATLVPPAAAWAIRLVTWTLRIRVHLHDDVKESRWEKETPVVMAFWHCQLIACTGILSFLCPHRRGAVLISRSRDGEYIARTAEQFGHKSARGSSSKAGAAGLREMIRLIRHEGYDGAVTPDGPRGPRCKVQHGVLAISKATGGPIYPITLRFGSKWEFRNWDRTQIPVPFTTCDFFVGQPLDVPEDTEQEAFDELAAELEQRMALVD